MSIIMNQYGVQFDFDVFLNLTDDHLREQIHGSIDTEQEFFDAYNKLYRKKYGEPSVFDTPNPAI